MLFTNIALIKSVDVDGDGKLDLEEFLKGKKEFLKKLFLLSKVIILAKKNQTSIMRQKIVLTFTQFSFQIILYEWLLNRAKKI